MDQIRLILREHGAATTRGFLDQAIRDEMNLLEGRLQELRGYLKTPLAQEVAQSSESAPVESATPLHPEQPQKKGAVKRELNPKRIHPIARAKAAKVAETATADPQQTQQVEPNPSEGEKKPPRGVLKAEQRRKEAAKRKELEDAGINPTSLLTKENLEQWLSSGKTFSQIAREDVGMREEDVSAAAKKHGLSSQKQRITGRENVIVVKGV